MLADTRFANPSNGTLTDRGTFVGKSRWLTPDFLLTSSSAPVPGPSADGRSRIAAGLAAGITEAVTVVTIMEVLKVRLQGQKSKAGDALKYRNAAHAAYLIARDEGPR